MPLADVDVGGDGPPADVTALCRSVELERRRVEGELISALIAVEEAKAYLADGHRCLAAYGRGVHRWDPLEARSRRGLVKLSRRDGRVVDRLLVGRIGVAQAHLIGRLFEMRRVGVYVELFLDMFLDWAAMLDYVDFAEQIRTWRLLVDQDGPNPEKAHRDRGMRVGMSDHTFRADLAGPAIDGVRLSEMLRVFEGIEWDIDWATTTELHGDLARPDLMPRTPAQRRYDAFQNLLDHVTVPVRRPRTEDGVDDLDNPDYDSDSDADAGEVAEGTSAGDGDGDADIDGGSCDRSTTAGTPATATHTGSPPPAGMQPVVHLIADIDTFLAALDRAYGGDGRRPFPVPFGPQRPRCGTFDGEFVSPRDIILAAIAGQVRLLLTDGEGKTIAMTRATRFFRGALREAALANVTRCGQPGCLVRHGLHVDHDTPHAHGGPTSIDNAAGGACGHHNDTRYTRKMRVRRHPDGRLTTHRPDGTDIAPPD
jgi:hypothetical protein